MKYVFHLTTLSAFLFYTASAWATNGMNMIGYGAVSTGMGGADIAVVDNASAMNINPAGICSCEGPQLSFGASLLMPDLEHNDAANDVDAKEKYFPLPSATYVTPLKNSPFTVGLGAFAQGGMGVEYNNLTTPFATLDKLYSNISYLKVTPSLAWQNPNRDLKIGASLHLGKVNAEIEYFPETYVDGVFDGFKVDNLEAYGYGLRIGFQYRIDNLTIGGTWLSKTNLDFEDGELSFAGTPGKKTSAKMKNFDWPQQIGLGVAYEFDYNFRVAADVDWIEWSQAVDQVTLSGGVVPIEFDMSWDDQWVIALGAEWEFARGWLARLGYNHGNSPVPNRALSTLFPAIVEDHVTVGLGYHTFNWKLDMAYEYGFENKQTNTLIGSTESHKQQTAHLMFTWLF